MKNILKIVFVIIGTIVGAGFASGQEIHIFFGKYGKYGIIGLVFSCILTGAIIYKTLEVSRKEKITTYKKLLNKLIGVEKSFFIVTINIIISIFLGISFIVMAAGFGAYFSQEFGISSITGCLLMCCLCFVVLKNKNDGIIKINEIGMPALILLIIELGIILKMDFKLKMPNVGLTKIVINPILYTSYNTITLIPVLVNITNTINSKKSNLLISSLCSIILMILGTIIFNLIEGINNISQIQLPMISAAKKAGSTSAFLYGIVILIAMFTSAVSSGFALIKNTSCSEKRNYKLLIILSVVSVIVCNFGFSNLINILYPIFGYLGIIQMFFIFKA